MCGIAGYCLNEHITPSQQRLEHLMRSIRGRGPDDEGLCLISRRARAIEFGLSSTMSHDLALVHARYSILDLSSNGHQPFVSRDGHVIAIYQGEIYNYKEIREELMSHGVHFRTQCDTEVLVEGYVFWKDDLWAKLNGFWGVVLFDRRSSEVVLSRDRLGVAPLYYRHTTSGVFFSSYLQTLIEATQEPLTPNMDVVWGFLQTGFKDLNESTYYQEIHSFPAGCVAHIKTDEHHINLSNVTRFWSLPSQSLRASDISFNDAVVKVRDLIFDAVNLRLRADVKVAFELSGGLDSSAIVAAAAQARGTSITTFTAKIKGADEEPYARTMRGLYHLDYHVIEGVEDKFSDDYAAFSAIMEEPYDNPNAYTHHLMLKQMKAQGVHVVLTGAGGDEVFAGYEASFWPKAYQEWRKKDRIRADWYEFCRRYKTVPRALETLGHYASLLKPRRSESSLSVGPATTAMAKLNEYGLLTFEQQRRFHVESALLPYYMRSSDHFTMGIPIEHRFPLLDYRLVELGLQLPISYLFCNGWTKYIVRKAMEPYLPKKITWRRTKMGFKFPYASYFLQHKEVFEPLYQEFCLTYLGGLWPLSYSAMLNNDPLKLWRFLSTAIWFKGCRR